MRQIITLAKQLSALTLQLKQRFANNRGLRRSSRVTPAESTKGRNWISGSRASRPWFAPGAGGLGRGCAQALANEGVNLTIVARGKGAMAKQAGNTADDIAQQRLNSIPAGCFGDPLEFGQLCAYICSAQASYITGQNF